MENKEKIIKSLEKMLDMLPETLTEEEKEKVEEIRGLLKKASKDNSIER